MKRIILKGIATVSILFISVHAGALVIKMGTLAPDGTSWIDLAKQFSKKIDEVSGGRVKFVWYTGGVMGDEPQMIRKIRFGQLHGGGFTGMGLGIVVPEVRVVELPLLFNTYDEVDYVLDNMLEEFKARFRKKRLELLGWAENGFVYAFSQIPIKKIEDLKKIKMWVWAGDSFAQEVFSSLGALSPIPLEVTGVLLGLQAGMINAFYNTFIGTVALQWHTQVKYYLDQPISYSASALVMSTKVWNKIPPDVKAKVIELGTDLIKKMKEIARQDNEKARQAMLAAGIKPIKPTPELINFFKENVKKAYKKLEGKYYDRDLLNKIKSLIEEFRRKKKKQVR